MHFTRVGLRNIKTAISVLISIMIFVVLLIIDNMLGLDRNKTWQTPSNMYTPFFAGIAAVYATHKDSKSSYNQARIRAVGSVIGGYFGMVVIFISEFFLIDLLNLEQRNFILYTFLTYIFVGLSIIPLILLTVAVKQKTAVFITCLTFLSVTISIRNGGMPVFQFATNRVLSTLIGLGISLLVNNVSFFRRKNKDILFVSSLDNNFLSESEGISPFIKYKLNNLYYKNMPLAFATTRTLSSLGHIFDDVEVNYPMVVMNGSAIYNFKEKTFSNVYEIESDVRNFIDENLLKNDLHAFVYTINDNFMHGYHQKLINNGEIRYYNNRKNGTTYSFVRGELPADLNPCLYVVIDLKEKIDKFIESTKDEKYSQFVDIISYPYNEEFYYLKINTHIARKEKSVSDIIKENNFNKLIVCGSGQTDIPLIKKADLSVCLKKAPEYIKKEVDIILSDDPADVLKLFDRIYHCSNPDKLIKKIKSK